MTAMHAKTIKDKTAGLDFEQVIKADKKCFFVPKMISLKWTVVYARCKNKLIDFELIPICCSDVSKKNILKAEFQDLEFLYLCHKVHGCLWFQSYASEDQLTQIFLLVHDFALISNWF